MSASDSDDDVGLEPAAVRRARAEHERREAQRVQAQRQQTQAQHIDEMWAVIRAQEAEHVAREREARRRAGTRSLFVHVSIAVFLRFR